ncbi:hydrogen gas-evolving membrane-bound hydrogenase subunit E [Thermocatellispora tengchongensis]|uniref:hydrogen gas-evolving membrane-bound hydrogenase subunit E n=1 Tax=Thermocatellispora tengchongensis TaxID=1073253 RepID=UPI003634B5B6
MGAFGAKEGHAPTEVAHPPGAAFLAPAGLLAAAGLALGAGAPALNAFTAAYVGRYPPGPHDEPLALWHGLTVPLAESALVIAAGALLFRRWRSVPAFRFPLDAEHGYRVIMRGVDRAADQATRFTQRGSLPVYLRSILLALLLLPGGALVSGGPWPHDVRPWQVPAEPAVVALVCAAALAAVLQPRRLGAVVCAGVAGTGTATLYVLYGAPDLGLTQFLTETVTLVAFVLVLRRLPARFGERQVAGIRVVNALFAVAAGLVVAGVALAAVSVRTAVPESALYPQAAERAGGTNIVNIALVDLRAWDTMGESAVLLVAAVGVVGLIYGRRRPTLPRVGDATGPVWAIPGAPRIEEPEAVRDAATWLRGAETLSPERRSILFEVAARLLFHPMLVLSAYLLFSGHGSPGGGFAAGLVTGLALTMRYLAGGRYELAEALPLGPGVCQGIGLAVVAGIGLAGLAISGEVLRQAVLDARLPLLGEVHFTTSTIFDAGVYLVVVGVVLDILRAMGAELDRRVEREHEEVATA